MSDELTLSGTEVQRLITERELLSLVAASWADIDLERGANIASFFTEDGVFDLGPARYLGRQGIDDAFRSRVQRGPRTARHFVCNQRVELAGADRARVSGYMVLYASDGEPPLTLAPPATVGEIVDTFVREDGHWLIESRVYHASFLSEENPSPFMNATGRA